MDPQQQQAFNQMAGLGVGVILFFFAVIIAVVAFLIFLLWRIFTKAGLSGPLSLLVIVPFGPIIVLCILAFSEWKVVPVGTQAAGLSPYPGTGYPPAIPPSYPPAGNIPPSTNYPPQGPAV